MRVFRELLLVCVCASLPFGFEWDFLGERRGKGGAGGGDLIIINPDHITHPFNIQFTVESRYLEVERTLGIT